MSKRFDFSSFRWLYAHFSIRATLVLVSRHQARRRL